MTTRDNVIINGSFEPLIKGLTDKTQRGILRASLRRAAQQTVLKEARKNVKAIASPTDAKALVVKSTATNFKANARIGAKRRTRWGSLGHLLEKGTGAHIVESKTDISDIRTRRNRKKLMVGRKDGIIYGTRVRNPGARSKPWLAPAWAKEKRPAVAKFGEFIVEEIDKAVAKGKR